MPLRVLLKELCVDAVLSTLLERSSQRCPVSQAAQSPPLVPQKPREIG